MSTTKRSRWIEAFATVAVASLAGPQAGGAALFLEVVKAGTRRLRDDEPSRELRRQVTNTVTD